MEDRERSAGLVVPHGSGAAFDEQAPSSASAPDARLTERVPRKRNGGPEGRRYVLCRTRKRACGLASVWVRLLIGRLGLRAFLQAGTERWRLADGGVSLRGGLDASLAPVPSRVRERAARHGARKHDLELHGCVRPGSRFVALGLLAFETNPLTFRASRRASAQLGRDHRHAASGTYRRALIGHVLSMLPRRLERTGRSSRTVAHRGGRDPGVLSLVEIDKKAAAYLATGGLPVGQREKTVSSSR
jgi:hypothetical protein